MSGVQAERTSGKRSKWMKTIIFVLFIGLVLAVATTASMLDRPPGMPGDEDHVVMESFPNKQCMECHDPTSLPASHPIEYERFACTRCHEPGKATNPAATNR